VTVVGVLMAPMPGEILDMTGEVDRFETTRPGRSLTVISADVISYTTSLITNNEYLITSSF
jgi:hypothetical protein